MAMVRESISSSEETIDQDEQAYMREKCSCKESHHVQFTRTSSYMMTGHPTKYQQEECRVTRFRARKALSFIPISSWPLGTRGI